jgi:hypothetical protein
MAPHRPLSVIPASSAIPSNLTLTIELSAEQLDDLAAAVSARLQQAPTVTLVDAQTVADALGLSRDTIYSHAAELGGKRVGDGERPRWRFDLDRALAAWNDRSVGDGSHEPHEPVSRPIVRHRRGAGKGSSARLLPIHGADDAA